MAKKKYEITNIRVGNKANQAYNGQPDRSHIIYAHLYEDGELILGATLKLCQERVEMLIAIENDMI